MMATRDDEKNPRNEPPASGDLSARVPKRIPRLETASEMRGFPISPNGTALGLGKRASDTDEALAGDDEAVSPEESERIESLLRQVDDDLGRLIPRGPRSNGRSQTTIGIPRTNTAPIRYADTLDERQERAQRTANTSPGYRRRAAIPAVWKWIGAVSLLALLVAVGIVVTHEGSASQSAPTASTVRIPEVPPRSVAPQVSRTSDETPPARPGELLAPPSSRSVFMADAGEASPAQAHTKLRDSRMRERASSPTPPAALPSAPPADQVRDQLLVPFRPEAE
jgi:hypothetical protein